MPREKKKRGRREERKQKLNAETEAMEVDEEIDTDYPPMKRRKSTEADYIPLAVNEPTHTPFYSSPADPAFYAPPTESPFYGLLDEEEQEYFKRADEMLTANQFPNAQERVLFVDSVWREANGKELKIACSQSSSRVLERLIAVSNTGQLKVLFGKFEGHFLNLVQHRFASHCCEALFLRAAPAFSEDEVSKKGKKGKEQSAEEEKSMESLFLNALSELKGNTGYLLTERFGSHTLRVLLAILAGEPLDHPALASKKKESKIVSGSSSETHKPKRVVPESFHEALEGMIKESVSALDATYLRPLATHPIGNPTLQLLLSIEFSHYGKSKGKDDNSILRKLLPDDSVDEGSMSYSFLKGLLYDPVGSRLLEVIVQSAPGKIFRSIYKCLFKGHLGTQARNDIASFVAIRVLERLGKEDLEDAMFSILVEVPNLIDRHKLALLKTLIERCEVRGIDPASIAQVLQQDEAYGQDPEKMIFAMLHLGGFSGPEGEGLGPSELAQKQRYGSQLAQSMLHSSGPLSELIFNGLLALETADIIAMAKNSNTSRFIQDAVIAPSSRVQFRRKFLPQLSGHLCDLAFDARGAFMVDALWAATDDLFFLKQRFADELAEGESELRESFCGRTVWKNWDMDLYKRRRNLWINNAKDQGKEQDAPEVTKKSKSRIDQARARFASQSSKKQHPRGRHAIVSTNA